MSALQLNAEILRNLSIIADNEALSAKLLKYIKKLVKQNSDPTLMTKEEFFAGIEEAEKQIERGEGIVMLPNESLDEFLRRVG